MMRRKLKSSETRNRTSVTISLPDPMLTTQFIGSSTTKRQLGSMGVEIFLCWKTLRPHAATASMLNPAHNNRLAEKLARKTGSDHSFRENWGHAKTRKTGVRSEWHLLNFPRMPMYSDFLSGDRPGFGQQGKGFWPSLDGSRLNASGTIAHALFGDQHEQRAEFSILNSTDVLLAPSDPKLERVFEAQRARQAFGERGGLGHHQPDEVVGE